MRWRRIALIAAAVVLVIAVAVIVSTLRRQARRTKRILHGAVPPD